MVNGLAIWHYPHRTDLENVRFFAENGFSSVSMLGEPMTNICMDEKLSEEFASIVREKQLILTVHSKLPASHDKKDVEAFKQSVDYTAKWQKCYGLIGIYSFDVPEPIRDNVVPYIDYVLGYEQFTKVAVEDFGLTEAERRQIEPLKGNKRFGYLIDVGHMNIRLHGENTKPYTLFTNFPDECPRTEHPGFEDFLKAFRSKEFPIFEIHLHNNDGISDLHNFLENGTIEIQDIADVLDEIHFDGVLTIESVPGWQGYQYPEADELILKTYDFWKSHEKCQAL